MPPLTLPPAWHALRAHAQAIATFSLRQAFETDAHRFDTFSLQHEGLLLDYSKHLITAETLALLLGLAREQHVPAWIEKMFHGEVINHTERRAALHVALRGSEEPSTGGHVRDDVQRVLAQMRQFTNRIRQGEHRGETGRAFADVVNVGIGGSYLGPELACEALEPYADGRLHAHFVSNVDGDALHRTINAFDQWSVELGKRLADRILPELAGTAAVSTHDASTNGLIDFYQHNRAEGAPS
jgi:glucose-6-phosphate isomerase